MKREPENVVVLKDGTKVPADDFWLYAPTWFVESAARRGVIESIPTSRPARSRRAIKPAD